MPGFMDLLFSLSGGGGTVLPDWMVVCHLQLPGQDLQGSDGASSAASWWNLVLQKTLGIWLKRVEEQIRYVQGDSA